MIELKLANQYIKINKGELVSYIVDGVEYIHQKGNPGWQNSDTEMFPIIGPTKDADYKVWTPKGVAIQDQHGLLRELTYKLISNSTDSVVFQKKYIANTKISNSKHPEKSSVNELFWPYDFQFQKTFKLKKEGLEVMFKITAEEGMPFMLGYHPAFKTESSATQIKISDAKNISILDVKNAGSNAYYVPNKSAVTLLNKSEIKIKIEGFNDFMLWTEVDTMVCIEPITFYPKKVTSDKLFQGFINIGKESKEYKVFFKPNTSI